MKVCSLASDESAFHHRQVMGVELEVKIPCSIISHRFMGIVVVALGGKSMAQRKNVLLFAALSLLVLPRVFAENVTCSSDDMHRHYCHLAPDYTRVQMVHQRSGSACVEGHSWGTDERGLWVDHGCRADFFVDRSNYGPPSTDIRNVPPMDPNRGTINNPGYGVSGYNQPREKTITCSDNSGHGAHCNAITHGGVDMVHQISGSACRQDYSWGYDDSGIWVSHGCRAEFVLHGIAAD
jgi:hypothetical protein